MRLELNGRLLTRNTLLNLAGQTGPLLVAAVTIPFIIRALGVERFGLLSIVWLAPEYFAFIDLGLGRATIKYVAEALGSGDQQRMSRVVWTAVTFQIFLGLLGALGLISIADLLTQYVLNIPQDLQSESKTAFYLLALSIPLVLVTSSLSAVLAAAQRFDLVNAVGASFNIANLLLTLVGVVYFDWHLTQIVTMLVVSRLLALIVKLRAMPPCFPCYSRDPQAFAWGSCVRFSRLGDGSRYRVRLYRYYSIWIDSSSGHR